MSQARFQKQQREKAQREKAAAKLERRAARRAAGDDADAPVAAEDESAVLAELGALHARFDAGEIEFDEFAEAKEQLLERLRID